MKAILLCAGSGKRFQPITHTCPKSLVPINGLPLIERTIAFLSDNAVNDITIVTGYAAEQFDYLTHKYGISLVHNELFASTNNWSSLFTVRDQLDDSLVIDGDLYFLENFLPFIKKDRSQFISQETTYGKEWELIYDPEKRVSAVNKWSSTGYGMVGLSFWTGAAATALSQELTKCSGDDYWEDAALRILDKESIYVSCVPHSFVQEIDSIHDALEFELLTHKDVAELISIDFPPQQLKGLTNNTWKVRNHLGEYQCLRVPGKGTSAFINRAEEPELLALIKELGITPPTLFYPGGLKCSAFLESHRVTEQKDLALPYFDQLAKIFNLMHSIEYPNNFKFAPAWIVDEISMYQKQSNEVIDQVFLDWIKAKATYFDSFKPVFCHRDLLLENMLIRPNCPDSLQLIDFEYAGFTHPLWDAASFILEAELSEELSELLCQALKLSTREKKELEWMKILVDYIWGMWGRVNQYEAYADKRLSRSKKMFSGITL